MGQIKMSEIRTSITNGRPTEQSTYDKYNEFVFSNDKHIFFKMVKRIELFNIVKTLPGDIVECGVFKGSGMSVWLKLLDMYTPHDIRKVIGFDFFDPTFVNGLQDNIERDNMQQVFDRCANTPNPEGLQLYSQSSPFSVASVSHRLLSAGIPQYRFELIKGDISETSLSYVNSHPGMRISLLYMDLDLEYPTEQTLNNLWDRVVNGGIIVFDEYAYGTWTESNAVDNFVRKENLVLHKIDLQSPTAYIVKGETRC